MASEEARTVCTKDDGCPECVLRNKFEAERREVGLLKNDILLLRRQLETARNYIPKESTYWRSFHEKQAT